MVEGASTHACKSAIICAAYDREIERAGRGGAGVPNQLPKMLRTHTMILRSRKGTKFRDLGKLALPVSPVAGDLLWMVDVVEVDGCAEMAAG